MVPPLREIGRWGANWDGNLKNTKCTSHTNPASLYTNQQHAIPTPKFLFRIDTPYAPPRGKMMNLTLGFVVHTLVSQEAHDAIIHTLKCEQSTYHETRTY